MFSHPSLDAMDMGPTILVIDDDRSILKAISGPLSAKCHVLRMRVNIYSRNLLNLPAAAVEDIM